MFNGVYLEQPVYRVPGSTDLRKSVNRLQCWSRKHSTLTHSRHVSSSSVIEAPIVKAPKTRTEKVISKLRPVCQQLLSVQRTFRMDRGSTYAAFFKLVHPPQRQEAPKSQISLTFAVAIFVNPFMNCFAYPYVELSNRKTDFIVQWSFLQCVLQQVSVPPVFDGHLCKVQ